MRILILSNEVWNDKINGNNVTSNWFEGMDAEFANIYASPETPFNKCCRNYFQITDVMMLKSIFTGRKAGKRFSLFPKEIGSGENRNLAEPEPRFIYSLLKPITGDFLRFIRELLWLLGRYDMTELKTFIKDFQPDIIFSERMASCKMLRLEKIVSGITEAPLFAFTGDDEYSLRQWKFSPFFWLNRFMIRRRLKDMVKKYRIYYTLSDEQKVFYEKCFHCKCDILRKCGVAPEVYTPHRINHPIKLIYAGKLYCNRWKMLAHIAKTLSNINQNTTKMVLEIYTKETPTRKQKKLLDDKKNSFIKGSVSQEKLKAIYQQADIALHVESSDIKNRLATRLSFSTKIIDCIFSGCAVLAFCWNKHSGYTYLKREDAAICVSNKKELIFTLNAICDNPNYVNIYAEKAYKCGKNNHKKKIVQNKLKIDFETALQTTHHNS